MMRRVFISDWLKMRRAWVGSLAILGPAGVIIVNAAHYIIKYNDLVKPDSDNWANLVQNIHPLLVATLILGITLLASLVTGLEHQANSWKMLCALPVPKFKLYLSKFWIVICLLILSSILSVLGTTLLGISLGFGFSIPLTTIIFESFGILAAATFIVSIQLWLSAVISNQVIPLTIGVVGVVFNLAYKVMPHWIPWVYPFLAGPLSSPNNETYIVCGLVFGIVLLLIGGIHFSKREIKQ